MKILIQTLFIDILKNLKEDVIMAKSKLIKDVAVGDIDLHQAFKRLLVITTELENEKLNQWIKNELKGYRSSDDIPEYRKQINVVLQYSGINSRMQVTNAPLPLNFISEKHRKNILTYDCKDGISLVEKHSKSDESIGFDCTFLASDVYENTQGLVSCISIKAILNNSGFSQIIETVSTNLLEILIELEKEFGVLDDLDINIDKSDNVKKINDNINNIMSYNDMEIKI